MAQHFLLTKEARTLTLASVARMSDQEAEAIFRRIRWADNHGDPFCPKCGCSTVYDCRRANGDMLIYDANGFVYSLWDETTVVQPVRAVWTTDE